ncbi:MAG: LytTR family transcriptional regulator DNA-binding domain-containing protein [Bacteroidetes bacterium]|nr:LytTR family transcriptional regulator DNA-binding domain-containing protein [Bacteroidota bacterium]
MQIENSTIGIPTPSTIERVYVFEILHLKQFETGTRIFLTENRILESLEDFSYFDEVLDGFNFFKLSRNQMVNLYHVRNFKKREDKIYLSDHSEIEIAPKKKSEIKRILFNSPLVSLTKRNPSLVDEKEMVF